MMNNKSHPVKPQNVARWLAAVATLAVFLIFAEFFFPAKAVSARTIVLRSDVSLALVDGTDIVTSAKLAERNSRTFVPIGDVAELFGAEVSFDGTDFIVTLGNVTVTMTMNNLNYTKQVGDGPVDSIYIPDITNNDASPEPPQMIEGLAYAPVAALAHALDCYIYWTMKDGVHIVVVSVTPLSETEQGDLRDAAETMLSESYTATSGIYLDKSAISFTIDSNGIPAAETLVATIEPSDATNKTVRWASGNTSVATVDEIGNVTAVGEGQTTVTAYSADNSHTATCAVTVNVVWASSVTLSQSTASYTLEYNHSTNAFVTKSFQLTAEVSPANAAYQTITWSSSNQSVATVSSSGYVTVVGIGSASITASCPGASAVCAVTAVPVLPESVVITTTPASFNGFTRSSTVFSPTSLTLKATVYPLTAYNNSVTWSSNAPSVATVSGGVVTPKGIGSTTITATCGTVSGTYAVKVNELLASGVVLTVKNSALNELKSPITATVTGTAVTDSFTISAVVNPPDTYNKTIKWTITGDADTIAFNSATGAITPKKPGTAIITATCGPASSSVTINVYPEMVLKQGFSRAFVNGRVFAPEYTAAVNIGGNMMVPAELVEAMTGAKLAKDPAGTMLIDGHKYVPAVATFEALKFNVKYVGGTGSNGYESGENYVLVTKADKYNIGLVNAKIAAAKKAANWSIIAPTKVLILPGGEIKLTTGKSLRLQSLVQPENATSYNVTWSIVSGSNLVTLNETTGLVTAGTTRGTATIKVTAAAKDGSKPLLTATCTVEVVVPVERVRISKTTFTFAPTELGQTVTLYATVEPAEAVQNVAWRSSDDKVATVSPRGVVTAKGYGTATITVTSVEDPSKRAACVVTVQRPVAVSWVKLYTDPVVFFAGQAASVEVLYEISPTDATNKNATLTITPENKAFAAFSTTKLNYINVYAGNTSGTATLKITTEDQGKFAVSDVIVVDRVTSYSMYLTQQKASLYKNLGKTTTLTLRYSDQIEILGTVGNWYYVQKGNTRGFISKNVELSTEKPPILEDYITISHQDSDPIQISISGNDIVITGYVHFTENNYNSDLIIPGIQKQWTGDFYVFNTYYVTVQIKLKTSSNNSNQKYIIIDSYDYAGVSHFSPNSSWSKSNGGTIIMYSGDTRSSPTHVYSDSSFQWTVSHEFGHALGIADAYNTNPTITSIMNRFGTKVQNVDIQKMLRAFETNTWQTW
ncbi:MAG: Ig-like domain-containing protein [Oscillospiraceae bacterium]|jgi:uncharacterized protein YjdB|nr:Ig-like domain-containing protein [Oscillospiraceae bacterium]